MPALARLIAGAAAQTQVIAVTHNEILVSALTRQPDANPLRLEKSLGETSLAGMAPLDRAPWQWPLRQ